MAVVDPLERFAALPTRLFLDSSVLQTLLDSGECIFENVPPEPGDRGYRVPGFLDDLEALRVIFQVNERAGFDIVLSENSLSEVWAKNDGAYIRWALDVLYHWQCRVEEYQGPAFDGSGEVLAAWLDDGGFGYLSVKDKILLQDAIALSPSKTSPTNGSQGSKPK